LVLAFFVGGSTWIRETVLPETVDRVLAAGTRAGRSVPPGYLVASLLLRAFPWSWLAAFAGLLAWRRGDALRLPASLLAGGLAILSLSRGLRADYALPLVPLVALLAAAVLLEHAPIACGTAWRRGALACAAGLMLVSLAAASGVISIPASGPFWTSCAALAVALLLVSTLRAPRSGAISPAAVRSGIAALLLFHAGYNAVLSPVARSGREPALRAFARAAAPRIAPPDRLGIVRGVPRSIFFLLRHDHPGLSTEDVSVYSAWRRATGRRLLVAREREAELLEGRWPHRFQRLLDGPLVLLVDTTAEVSRG
jgi:hypothetical protein